MAHKERRMGVYLPLLILFAAATVVTRTLALIYDYDKSSAYFTDKTLINISTYLLLGMLVILFSYIFFAEKHAELKFDFDSEVTYIPTALAAFSTLFLGFSLIFRAGNRGIEFFSPAMAEEPMMIFELCLFILAILASAYFAMTVLLGEKHSELRGAFGLICALFLVIYAVYIYFDTTLPINAPNKMVDETAYLFASLFFLFETRLSLGRESFRGYAVFGLISALLSLFSSIPSLIFYFSREIMISNSIYDCFLSLSLSIYMLTRLISLSKAKHDSEHSFVKALREGADEVEKALNDKEEKEKLEYIDIINRAAKKEAERARLEIEAAARAEATPDEETEAPAEAIETLYMPEDEVIAAFPGGTISEANAPLGGSTESGGEQTAYAASNDGSEEE